MFDAWPVAHHGVRSQVCASLAVVVMLFSSAATAAAAERAIRLSPDSGPARGGTTVRVDLVGGSIFGSVRVNFGDRPAPAVRRLGLATLEVVTPPGAVGPVPVRVENTVWGASEVTALFTYTESPSPSAAPERAPDPPVITGVEVPPIPDAASVAPIRVRGAGFRPDSRIRIASADAETRFRSAEELEGDLPVALLGRLERIPLVVITPPPGGGASNPWILTVVAPPPPPPPPPPPRIAGRYVVFTSNRREGRNHLFLFDRQTGGLDLLEEANSLGGNDAYPAISADGRFIVFQSDRRGQSDIFLFDRETRTLDALPEANHALAFDGFPSISADGRVIVFESDRVAGKPKIFLFDRESRTLSELRGANEGPADDGLAAVSN